MRRTYMATTLAVRRNQRPTTSPTVSSSYSSPHKPELATSLALYAFALSQSRLRANAISTLVVEHGVSLPSSYAHSSVTRHFPSLCYAATHHAALAFHVHRSGRPSRYLNRTTHSRTNSYAAVLESEQRITVQFLTASVALLAQLQPPAAAPATTANQQQSIPADATPSTEGIKVALEPPIDMFDDETGPTASEFVCFTY
jgi:hypothetical protein